jgi:Tfp pilus assembly protein PilX
VQSRARDERGTALLVAIMATALMSALGSALILTSITETAISANYRDGIEVLYAAEAAAALAIADLAAEEDWSSATAPRPEVGLDQLVPGAAGSSIRVGVDISPGEEPDVMTVTSTSRGPGGARRAVRVTVRRRPGEPGSPAEIVFWEQVP